MLAKQEALKEIVGAGNVLDDAGTLEVFSTFCVLFHELLKAGLQEGVELGFEGG